MLNENIKAIRRSKGLSQQELAVKVNVVRQTVSKWEKGLSVPDADLLVRLAEVLEVSVSQLLGAGVPPEAPADQVAEQLARINEQLAIKNRRAKRIWQCVAGVLIGLVVLTLVLVLLNAVAFGSYDTEVQSQTQTMSLVPNLTEREGFL